MEIFDTVKNNFEFEMVDSDENRDGSSVFWNVFFNVKKDNKEEHWNWPITWNIYKHHVWRDKVKSEHKSKYNNR